MIAKKPAVRRDPAEPERNSQKFDSKMNEEKILRSFEELSKAKKDNKNRNRLVVVLAGVAILGAFVFSFSVVQSAMNKIIVVDRAGEYLKISAEDSEQLFTTLVKATCSHLTHYANSFDRLTIKQNQAKAMILCHKNELQPVFNLYNQEKSYHEALERGVIYYCELEQVTVIGNTKPYHVEFTSILTITDGNRQTRFRIFSEGNLIPTTPQYPENTTGFFFTSYKQTLKPIANE